MNAPAMATISTTEASVPPEPEASYCTDARISSFDQKPASGKIPARASDPITNVRYVHGMLFRRPPMSLMLFECTAWITDPAQRNSRPLKNACVKRWNNPAVYAPAPIATVMYPSWDSVE